MNIRSLWLRRATMVVACLSIFGVLAAVPAKAKPMSTTDDLLRFFPNKPLGVFRAASLRYIVQDITTLAERAGFGMQVQMMKTQGFRQMQRFLETKKPITNWADVFQAVGLGSDPAVAVHVVRTPIRPYIGATVVLSVQNPARLTNLITEIIPKLRDRERFKNCKRYQSLLQSRLQRQLAIKADKEYTIKDLTRSYTPRRCPRGVKFRVEGKRVVSQALDQGLAGFRKLHGTRAWTKSLGKLGKLYKLHKFTYALVNNRYLVWSSRPLYRNNALRRFQQASASPALAAGFRKHLSEQARFQVYMNYEQYVGIAQRLQEMINNVVPGTNHQLQNTPQMKKFQQMAINMSKGYDALWLDARAQGNRYSMYSVITTLKDKAPIVDLIMQMTPTPLRSLAMLPQNTVAVFSMNILQLYFQIASIFLKQAGNKALSQFVFSIGQWQKMFGDEITLAVASSPQSPIQGMFLLEVKQPQQLEALLSSLQAMLAAGGKSPLQTETYQNVNMTYLFRGQQRPKPGKKSPADQLPPGEIAWAFVGNYFVLTYQMTPKPNLHLLKRMIDPKIRRQTSLVTHPVLNRLLQRIQRTNILMYVAMPELLRAVRMFAPPIPQVQQAIRALQAFNYIFAHSRNHKKKGVLTAEGEIALTPAPTTAPQTQPGQK